MRFMREKSLKNVNRSKLSPVSVLKPLKGVDPNLALNLESFFTMDYPVYELLFCVQDYDDPAIDVVTELMQKYPRVDAKLVLGGSNVGINPKINNMNPAYEKAKYELIMISDDKIFVLPDTLLDMVDCMDEDVGMVNQVAYFRERDGFLPFFEKIIFNSGIIKYLLFYKVLTGVSCNGMSALVRKDVLEMAGGLKYFGGFIVEDNEMSNVIDALGWNVTFSRQFALQNSGTCDISSIYMRLQRWLFVGVKYNPVLHPLVYLAWVSVEMEREWKNNNKFLSRFFFVIFLQASSNINLYPHMVDQPNSADWQFYSNVLYMFISLLYIWLHLLDCCCGEIW